MLAGGVGQYGPYLLVNRRLSKRGSAKVSTGTKGAIIGGKYKNRRFSASVDYNLTTKSFSPSLKIRKKRG